MPLRRHEPDPLAAGKVEAERSRRREVFREVETAGALLGIDEVAVPLGPGRPCAVGTHRDRGKVRVRLEAQAPVAGRRGLEVKGRVLVMEGVVIAPGKKRPDLEGHGARPGDELPGNGRGRGALRHEDLLCDARPVRERERPARPGLEREGVGAGATVRVGHIRPVGLRRDGVAACGGRDPGVEPVHEHDASRRRRRRGQEERVIPAGPDPRDRPRGEAAEPVRFEPLPRQGVSHGQRLSFPRWGSALKV